MRVRFDSGSLMKQGLENEFSRRELREWVVGGKGNTVLWSVVGMVR